MSAAILPFERQVPCGEPPAEQRVFATLYGREPARSHAEAAQRLGLSVQRVRQVLFEVRGKLRAMLEGDAP